MSTLGDMLGGAEEEEPCLPCGMGKEDTTGGGECSPMQTLLVVLIVLLLILGSWLMWKQYCAGGSCVSCTSRGDVKEGHRSWVGKALA